jgi:hypothetical protein
MPTPLLMDELTSIEAISLGALKMQPGFPVLEKILMEACRRATAEAMAVNPTDEHYIQNLTALQGRARERSEFSLLILQSIEWHGQSEDEKERAKAESEGKRPGNPILRGMK